MSSRRIPFEPGWDRHCCDVAAEHVRRATGRDVWSGLGGAPRSPRQAADLYRRLGVRDLRGAMGALFGPELPASEAMRGDLVLVMSGNIAALGICRGELIECADNMLPIGRAACCWRLDKKRTGPWGCT